MIQLFSTLAAFLFAALANPCPDQVVEYRRGETEYGPHIGCSGSVTVSHLNISTSSRCPATVLVTPAHTITKASPDSGTYTRPSGYWNQTLVTFTCRLSWVIFLPLGTECAVKSERVVARHSNYVQLPCGVCGPDTENQ